MKVFVCGEQKEVVVTYKRNKKMYLRLKNDGILYVTCPRSVTKKEISDFIIEKQSWIMKMSHRGEERASALMTGQNQKEACWLGKIYPVEFSISSHAFMSIETDRIIFYLPQIDAKKIKEIFYREASMQLKAIIEERKDEWEQKICRINRRPLPSITLKYMTSRWGSYSPATNRICLSLRLIHFPVECTEYVLLHEYAHILEGNHSQKFYDIIKMHMPEYKRYSDLLK